MARIWPSKYEGRELKEYFDIINIYYYDAILGMEFLRKHEVIIDFVNNCLRVKDKIVRNQANKYKVEGGNLQKNMKNVSMKALKQEEPIIPHKDNEWLSKKSYPRRGDKKDSVNCQIQEPVGLKKNLNEYTHSDIPQLHEEITEKYSDLLGPLPSKFVVITAKHLNLTPKTT